MCTVLVLDSNKCIETIKLYSQFKFYYFNVCIHTVFLHFTNGNEDRSGHDFILVRFESKNTVKCIPHHLYMFLN